MEFHTHGAGEAQIAEVISDTTVITTVDDALDLIGNLGYQGFGKAILHAKNLAPDFFDLRTKLAGEVLQKFTNYRLRVAIVGDFTNVTSNSFRDFIRECNRGKQVCFTGSIDEAITQLNR